MRHIYLIRHCRPEFPNGSECCLSRTDTPLSEEGAVQAEQLGRYFSDIPLTAVYCSRLTRAVQTAEAIVRQDVLVIEKEALQEIDCGGWEGMTLAEVRKKYPEQYARRGIDPVGFVPKQGESLSDGLSRFQSAVEQILSESTGDIAVVAHASVNRAFLCSLLQKDLHEVYSLPQPYGCINKLIQEQDSLRAERIGFLAEDYPDETIIRCLWKRYCTPEMVIAHCRAVAGKAMRLAKALSENGYVLNAKLIYSAAMLHDIARSEPDHAVVGAKWLLKEGYGKVADVIVCHHDLTEDEYDPVTEKTIVFLADKLVSEDREVTLEERFTKSASKCLTAEAKASHTRKYDQALAALSRVQLLTSKE